MAKENSSLINDVRVTTENDYDYTILENMIRVLDGRPWSPGILGQDATITVSKLPD